MKKLTILRVVNSNNKVKRDLRNGTLMGELETSQFDTNESSVNC